MLKRIICAGTMLMLLAGCGTFVVEGEVITPTVPSPTQPALERANPSPQPTSPATEDPTLTPTHTAAAQPAQSSPIPAGEYAGWSWYVNEDYGFSFLYPPGWSVEPESELSTLYQHALIVQPPDVNTVALRIAYKRLGSELMIGRTGVGAGDLVDGGSVPFIGSPIGRRVLVGQEVGQHITVLYGQGEIERGNVVFTLNLDCGICFENTSGILEPVEDSMDMIIASFELTS